MNLLIELAKEISKKYSKAKNKKKLWSKLCLNYYNLNKERLYMSLSDFKSSIAFIREELQNIREQEEVYQALAEESKKNTSTSYFPGGEGAQFYIQQAQELGLNLD